MKFKAFHSASRLFVIGVLVSAVLAVACGGAEGEPTPASPAPDRLEGNINVFAAASLTDAFSALGEAFEEANPDVSVNFNFASSSALAIQINEGAPADVFASADNNQMAVVADAGNAEAPQRFVRNLPVTVVPADSDLTAFEDLARAGLRLVLAGPDVPIGRYSRQILEKASGAGGIAPEFGEKVLANLRSDEANVRAVLSKVQLGEADAGIVYQTDAAIAGDEVRVIEIPEAFNVIAEYPIAAVRDSSEAEIAAAFVAYVLSGEGQAILRAYGFSSP